MQNTEHQKETKHSPIDLFFFVTRRSTNFFSAAPAPRRDFSAVYPESLIFLQKKIVSRLISLLSKDPPLDFLKPIRCISGVLVSFAAQKSICLHFHPQVLIRNPGAILHFHLSFNSIYFFLLDLVCFSSNSQMSPEVTDVQHILVRLMIPVETLDVRQPLKLKG